MIKKFMFLTKYGLKKRIKSKSFIIANIVLLILIIGLLNIDGIIKYFGGEFNEIINVFVIDNTNESFELFEKNFEINNLIEDNNLKINEYHGNINILKEKIKGKKDIIIVLNNDLNNYLDAKVISDGYIENLNYQYIVQSINSTKHTLALRKSNIDISELEKITKQVNVERIILDEEKTTDKETINMIMSFVFPTLILPIFMLIVLLVQFIGSEINEEKTTRSMEVIISNVPAKIHFYSKIASNNIFIILQTIMLLSYAVIGFSICSNASSIGVTDFNEILSLITETGFINQLIYIIPLTLLLMILSFIAYSLISGILASITVNQEDYQQVQTPIVLICVIGYYLSIMASSFEGSIFIKILSYVPLISCLLSPALLVIGQIGIMDIVISIIILFVFVLFVAKYGLKIYKVGILNYSTDKIWKKVFSIVRKNKR